MTTGPGQKGVKITKESAHTLSKLTTWGKGFQIGSAGVGHRTARSGAPGRGPWLGKTQAAIAAGTMGPVNFWTGPKLQETDYGSTIQAAVRFASLSAGQWVLFDIVDRGYEVIAAYPCASM